MLSSMDEADFRNNSKKLSILFTRSEVEGVYETHVPSLFRAVMQLGCVCGVTRKSRNKNASEVFDLEELESKDISNKPNTYLDMDTFKSIFFYHSHRVCNFV